MSEPMRINRYLARSGVASRRHSEDLVRAGEVSVNGEVVTDLSTCVTPGVDEVVCAGERVVLPDDIVTLALHKPCGYVTTMGDAHAKATVAELMPSDRFPGLFPVGRLDRETSGLLLLTTDGQLAASLLHPREKVMKRYWALVDGTVGVREVEQLAAGVQLDDGMTLPAEVRRVTGVEIDEVLPLLDAADQLRSVRHEPGADVCAVRYRPSNRNRAGKASLLSIGICEGRNRQVRRMCSAVGHPVLALHRYSIGGLALGDIPRGSWSPVDPAAIFQA